jgi:hypothetical protein
MRFADLLQALSIKRSYGFPAIGRSGYRQNGDDQRDEY